MTYRDPDSPDLVRLRDMFAGQAMAALIARLPYGTQPSARLIAESAYAMADAMMKARKGK